MGRILESADEELHNDMVSDKNLDANAFTQKYLIVCVCMCVSRGELKQAEKGLVSMRACYARSLLTKRVQDHRFYAFRWITLFCAQEFEFPDVIRLWDSLFSDPDRFHFLSCFCVAMVCTLRTDLLSNDFADNLKMLQVVLCWYGFEVVPWR